MLPQNIIIVEDEVITQRYIKNSLTKYSINVSGCYDSSDDVLAHIDRLQADMILMDINIKGSLNGIELAKVISNRYTIPIIFVTAYNDEETIDEVLRLSPCGFVNKPFQSKDIYIAVQIAYQKFLTHFQNQPSVNLKDVEIDTHYRFDRGEHRLYYQGEVVQLTLKQNILIELLATNLDITMSADRISDIVWRDEYMSDSSLRSLIYSIRKQHPNLPLKSDSKRGYYMSRHG